MTVLFSIQNKLIVYYQSDRCCFLAFSAATTIEMKEKLTPPASKPSSKHTVLTIPQIPALLLNSGLDKNRQSLKHPQTGKPWFDKSSIRLMTKCHAKQPNVRGRN